jgi:hypothetical protein
MKSIYVICIVLMLGTFCSHGIANDRYTFQRLNKKEVQITKNDSSRQTVVSDNQIKIELVAGQDAASLVPQQPSPRIAPRPVSERTSENESYIDQKSLGGIVSPSGSQSLMNADKLSDKDRRDLDKWRYLSRFPVNLQIVGDTVVFEWAGAQQRLKIPADGRVQLKLSPQ